MPQKEAARAEVGLGRPNSRLDIRKLVSYPLSRPGAKGRDVPPNPAAPLLKIQAEQHKMSKGSWWRRGASGSLAENGVFNAFVSSTAPSGPHLRRVTFNPACSPVKRPCFCAYLPFPLPFRSWTCWSTLDWCSGNTRTFAMFELSAYCLPRACPVSYSLPFPSLPGFCILARQDSCDRHVCPPRHQVGCVSPVRRSALCRWRVKQLSTVGELWEEPTMDLIWFNPLEVAGGGREEICKTKNTRIPFLSLVGG